MKKMQLYRYIICLKITMLIKLSLSLPKYMVLKILVFFFFYQIINIFKSQYKFVENYYYYIIKYFFLFILNPKEGNCDSR